MSYWDVIYKSAWGILGILVIIGVLCLFLPKIRQHQEYQRREALKLEEKRIEEQLISHLKWQQEKFKTDPKFVERIAHEQGMAWTNETIFKFVDDGSGVRSVRHADQSP